LTKVYTGTTTIEQHIKQLGNLYATPAHKDKPNTPHKPLTRAEMELHDMRLILKDGK